MWLPAEHQLRELLGGLFRMLRRDGDAWVVVLALPDAETGPREHFVTAASAEEAYGLALADVLEDVVSPV